ncbi:hypothetical protein V8E51_010035 [Hyaloscypha variabilis]
MDEPNIPRPHFKRGCICERLHVACHSSEDALQQVHDARPETAGTSAEEPQVVLETTLQKLEDSSNAGCWFCSILLVGVRTATENNPTSKIDGTTTIMAIDSRQSPLPFLLNVVSAGDNLDDCLAYEFYVPRKFYDLGYGNICACFRHAPETPSTTSSQESFAFAKEQLGRCIDSAYSTHANCESGITSLPTRILHIEKVGGEHNVRLLITKGLKGKYIADHAKDGQGGCFNSPTSNWWLVRTSDQEAQVAVRRAKYHAGFFRPNRSEGYKRLAPLATRAWAFQETTLAPRALHFVADELLWTCGGHMTCQCGGLLRDGRLRLGSRKFVFKGCNIDKFVEGVWYGLLGDYLARLLTKPEDRLPAMSGLAKSFDAQWKMMKARYMAIITTTASTKRDELDDTIATTVVPKDPGTYLAGLWSNYLDTGLQWTRPIVDSRSRISSPLISKPSSYLAPSWSWASLNAAAQYIAPRKPIQGISIIHATCTPDGLDPMGTVKDGKLVLSGPIILLKLTVTIALPEAAADMEQLHILRDYTDYAFSREDMRMNGLGASNSLDVYGLVMSPDFVMVLRRLSTVEEDVYERIGSLNYLEEAFECCEQPKEWARGALRKELTIV